MVNLLPKKEIAKITSSYYIRLATFLFFLLSGIIIVGGIVLIPSYLLAQSTAEEGDRYVRALEETVGLKERAGVTSEIRALSEKTRALKEFGEDGITTSFFEDVLNEKPRNVAVVGFNLSKGKEVLFTVTGVSETRSDLLTFVDGLKGNPRMKGVEIPVNQLAVDKDLPFSIQGTYIYAP